MSYKTIYKEETIEIEIKKSRFIGYASPVSSEEEAMDFIEKIKKKNPGARHNCYAYIIGEKMITQRYSDDGEPSGTAGIPILEILKKKHLTDICVVVTRYFGGILLGAGGLIRAYSSACNEVTNKAVIVEKQEFSEISIEVDYNSYGRLLNYIEENEFYILDKIFETEVIIKLYIKSEVVEKFKKDILDLTSGNVKIIIDNVLLLTTKNNKLYIEG
ncbi:YigZ family protein [Miniphocaeibacter halophilus]|uniref:YigZ family protein n=1 Tax=Miniphocaeibacter halophilus TaxID=2931922 RepID=A0AC61MSS5_9FIRM|nr:YigZ family protein [Miniphocaeibacter halophilus]QQK07501.1 YigZ family protein [Miniphocaeibacter halophilus]